MQVQQPQPVDEGYYSATSSCVLAQNLYFLFGKSSVDQAICAAIRPNNGILCSRDTCWCFGDNSYGQLGVGSTDTKQEPVAVIFPDGALQNDEKLVWVGACSSQHGPCFILTSTGTLYGFGYNAHGTVGINSTNHQLSPLKIGGGLDNKRVIKVAAGEYHVLALTDDGQLFGWGYGANGASGLGTTGNIYIPTRVKNLDDQRIVAIECSTYFSVALNDEGDVFTFGINGNGQLGLDNTTNPIHTPTLVQALKGKKIIQISAGEGHCLALSNSGEVYSWGVNANGQLGLGHQNQVNKPTMIFDVNINHIVAVHAFRNLSLVRRAGGECFIFGHKMNFWNVPQPQKIPDNPDNNPIQIFFRHFSLFSKSFFLNSQPTPTQKLLSQLENSFDQKEGSDITFQVDNKLIYAHKAIVQLRNTIFRDSLAQDQLNPFPLEQFTYEVWYAFFNYLYTGKVNVGAEVAIELVRCMNWHHEPQGQQLCEAIVRTGTNVENVSMIFGLASSHNMVELRNFTKGFIFRNFKAVVNTQGYEDLSLKDPKLTHSLIKDGATFPNLYGY